MGQDSVSFNSPFGTLSSSSRKLSGTPCTSLGGSSALRNKLSTSVASNSFVLSCSEAGPAVADAEAALPPLIISKALASVRYAAATSPGSGSACVLFGR